MKQKVVYELETGMICWITQGAVETVAPEGCHVIEVDGDPVKAGDYFVYAGELHARQHMNLEWHYEAAVGEVVVDRIPAGAKVTTPNWEGTVDDGFIAWPVTESGSYPITVEAFPYYPETINAEIT